jgi:hypothetical protein
MGAATGRRSPPADAVRREGARSRDPRREPRPGYAETELKPKRKPPKAPGEGGPFEPQNDPKRKPGRQNG